MRTNSLLAGICLLSASLPASSITITREGRPTATIVVLAAALAEHPTDSAAAKIASAAHELQTYLRKMSGAVVPIAGDSVMPSGAVILVGTSRQSAAAHVAIPEGLTPSRKEEGFVLACAGERLLLAGNDAGPYHGTEYAVYEFLERLGVRWYMPGDYGEYVPRAATIQFADAATTQHPDFRMRNWWLHATPEMEPVERLWKLRNRMCPEEVIAIPGDSSVRRYVADEAMAKSRPELFARNLDGTTNPYLPNLTSPDAVRIAADKMKQVLRTNATVGSAGLAPDDGLPRDFTPETRKLNQNLPELGGREGDPGEVSTSEEWFAFVNAVAREAKQEFPDRLIVTNGYANRDIPPLGIALDPNISVMYAAIWSDTLHAYDDPKSWQMVRQGQNIRQWTRLCDKLWIYGYDYTMLTTGLTPVPTTRKLARDLPLLKQWGVIGFHDETRNTWMETGIPTRYLRARLEWNTHLDVASVLDEFYSKWYGAASKPARAFWDRIEDAIQRSPMLGHEDRILPYVYSDALVDALHADIAEAEQLASDDRSRLHVRVDRLILDHLEAYLRMNKAEWAARFADAAGQADRMMAARRELNAISPFYCLPDERRYDSGVWYWGALDRAAYYRKLADLTSGKAGSQLLLLPERAAFRTDPADEGRFAGWYESGFSAQGWSTVSTTRPFYSQGYQDRTGYPYTGVVWYRFDIEVPKVAAGKRVVLFAAALETEAWTWVNGRYVGHRPYHEAYERPNELSLDVTDALKPGGRNTIAIRVHTSLNPAAAAGGLVSRVLLYSPN